MDENKIVEEDIENKDEKNGQQGSKLIKNAYEWLEIICVAIALMLVVFMFVFRPVQVEGDSMKNTLHNGDRLIISNAFYTPKAGDIVVIVPESGNYAETALIKRVIATEGQTVELDTVNWKVFITEKDGTKHELDESMYDSLINRSDEDMKRGYLEYPYTVPDGCVFVMGDNRNHSDDSRFLGAFGVDTIVGRVLFRISPISQFGNVNE